MTTPDPEIQFRHLLCERCKTLIEAARVAQEATNKLRELMGGSPLALPAQATVVSVPGKQLSRYERLAKAKAILPELKRQDPAPSRDIMHRTSGGTVVARPWLGEPRKKITARAERDLEKVRMGTMSRVQWIEKHGYSRALLEKRLSMMGAVQREPGKNPVKGYKPPMSTLSEENILRVVNGELTGNALAKELGMVVGTVYRLVELYRKEKKIKWTGRKGKPRGLAANFHPSDEDLELAYSFRLSTIQLAKKYGCGPSTALKWVHAYAKRVHGKEWTVPRGGARAKNVTDAEPEAIALDEKPTQGELDVFADLNDVLQSTGQ